MRRLLGVVPAAILAVAAMACTSPSAPSVPQVENPFAGATGYLNPQYRANVEASAAQEGGELGDQIRQLGSVPTAVWLDRIAAVTGGPGVTMTLRDHLDAALAQQERSGGTPVVVTLVVYDLPNRDCAALASNGELLVAENGEERYRTEYVDPLAEVLRDPRYDALRKVAIVEPDSLPNLVTNLSEPRCAEAQSSGAYVDGIRYALDRLHPIPNTYLYLDIAHSGWLGWDSNMGPAVNLITDTVRGSAAGLDSIEGFVSNTANYTPTEEPHLPDSNLSVGGQPVRSARFYEWNPYVDELDYGQAMRRAFVAAGFPDDIGMLIDTSRNGWGGPDRPSQPSSSTDLNTYVDGSRVDRRPHRGGWCNQSGAGLGYRPTAAPASGVDAYIWVKPPGESDGVAQEGVPDPNDPNKRHDPMCDPDAQNRYNSAHPTNALAGAPHAGRWFHDQLVMLVENAHPALSGPSVPPSDPPTDPPPSNPTSTSAPPTTGPPPSDPPSEPPAAPAREICGAYDTVEGDVGQAIVQNNVWGASTAQCIDVTGTDFRVTRSDHANTGGTPAAYPSVFEGCHWDLCTAGSELPLQVQDIGTASSTWQVDTGTAEGAWNAAYDLWFKTDPAPGAPDGAELMIWLDSEGGVQPAGSIVARDVQIAGATWNVWQGDIGWNYIAYQRTTPTSSGDLDLRAFVDDAVARGAIEPAWHLVTVEAGFEIWRGGAGLASSGFSFTGG